MRTNNKKAGGRDDTLPPLAAQPHAAFLQYGGFVVVSVPKPAENNACGASQVESRLSHVERMWYISKGFAEQALHNSPEEQRDKEDDERMASELERASLLWVCMNDLGCEYPEDIRERALTHSRNK